MNNQEIQIKCEVCGKLFNDLKKLNSHLGQTKCLSSREYYDKYLKKDDKDGYCLTCNKPTKFINLVFGYNKFCNSKCAHNSDIIKNKTKQTCLQKYGCEYSTQSQQMKDNSKNTMISRYGCEHALQVPEFQKKFKDTCIDRFGGHPMHDDTIKQKLKDVFKERYGTSSIMEIIGVREKIKETVIKKYGVENCSQSQEIKDKKKQTCINHFGTETSFQSEEVKDKIKQTMNERYGVDNPSKNAEIQQKKIDTSLKKYGSEHPAQTEWFKDKIKKTCLIRYGVTSFNKTDNARKLQRSIAIKRIEKQFFNNEPLGPAIGKNASQCLNQLQAYTNFKIMREVNIESFFADGCIIEKKIIIEFDEKYHNSKKQKERDDYKDKCCRQAGYEIFRIKEDEWLNNQNTVIKNFKSIISTI